MTNRQFERLVGNLQNIMRCPHCSGTYTMSDIHYLGQMETMTFLHMRCSSCETPVFASVALANDEGELLVSDLTLDDIALSSEDAATREQEIEDDFAYRQLSFDENYRDIPVEGTSEVAEKKPSTPISYNDVLEIHQFLDHFDGDVQKLMSS